MSRPVGADQIYWVFRRKARREEIHTARLDIQFTITQFNLSEKQTTPKGWGAKPLA